MATYDYQCKDCEHIQEESHPMAGPDNIIICVKCKSKNVHKIISAPYTKFIGDWQTNNVRGIDNKY